VLMQIGQKKESDFSEPIGMLEDCHKRILYFLKTLVTLADIGRERPLSPTNAYLWKTRCGISASRRRIIPRTKKVPCFPGCVEAVLRKCVRSFQNLTAWNSITDRQTISISR